MCARLKGVIVTIDGVAASGKSSVSSGVARALSIPYLSSGLLYRALTLLHLENPQLNISDLLVSSIAQNLRFELLASGNRAWLEHRELTADLHTQNVDQHVSVLARRPEVRTWVDERLRCTPAPFVAEGRDMGSTVFPDATAKFYLVAHPRIRAIRRAPERQTLDTPSVSGAFSVSEHHHEPIEQEEQTKQTEQTIARIEAELIERDRKDKQQSAPATDALIIHTDDLTLEQVISKIMAELEPKLGSF